MKVLWICNLMPAMFAEVTRLKRSNKEGWVTGAMETLLSHCKEDGIQLAVAFPLNTEEAIHGKTRGVEYFSFPEDTDHPEEYDPGLVAALGVICDEFRPDVIHVYGTEYPHTLAILRVQEWKKRVIVHLQGVMKRCAEEYFGGLPEEVTQSATFRDVIRGDSLLKQKEKYERRAQNEAEALKLADYACGRTSFDKSFFAAMHPDGSYYAVNESLRPCFYEGSWVPGQYQEHSLVMSQGNIPLKGAHVLIGAVALLKKDYPDVTLYVAGDNILRGDGPVNAIKRCAYGKYLRELLIENGLVDTVQYVGQLRDVDMKELYLASHVYVMPSFIENSPNSLGEAMLLGMPCVASRVGGIPSMAAEGEVSLVEPGNPQALADAIAAIFEDEEKARSMGAAAHKRAGLTFDREANYRMLRWVYETIIKEQ